MNLNEIMVYDFDKIEKLYNEFVKVNKHLEMSVFEFIQEYLYRCDGCGELFFKEDLKQVKSWNGDTGLCCEKCESEFVDNENMWLDSDIDPYDEYMDRKLEEEYARKQEHRS